MKEVIKKIVIIDMVGVLVDFKGELLSFGCLYEKQEWNKYRIWEEYFIKIT